MLNRRWFKAIPEPDEPVPFDRIQIESGEVYFWGTYITRDRLSGTWREPVKFRWMPIVVKEKP